MASRRIGSSSALKLARLASNTSISAFRTPPPPPSPPTASSSSSSSSSSHLPPPPSPPPSRDSRFSDSSSSVRHTPPPPIISSSPLAGFSGRTDRAPKRKQPVEVINNRLASIILSPSPPRPPPISAVDPDQRPPPPPPSPITLALLVCQEMVQHNVPPTPLTYSLLIQICLKAQSDRSIERSLPPVSEEHEEGSEQTEELRLERQYITEMTWLEKRRRLLWQGQDPTGMNKPVRGAWFGSAEFEIGWGFCLDAEARGIKVPREGLDALMKMSHIHPSLTSRVTPLLSEPSTDPTSHTLELALLPYISIPRHSSSPTDALADVDRILSIYADARAQNVFPSKEAMQQIILRLVAVGWSNAAVDMAADYEEHIKDKRHLLSPETWGDLMRAIARKGKTSSLLAAWELSINSGRLSPDVGLIQDCLLLFGKAGLPEICLQLFALLKSKGLPLAEHHYASLIQAWVKTDELENAFWTLALMRQDGVLPNDRTAMPILGLILGKDGRAPETEKEAEVAVRRVDQAWFALVQSKEKRGVVDVTAANVVLLACLSCADFVRTAETFNEFSTLSVSPNLDSYHYLLDACLLRPTETYPLFLKIQTLLSEDNIVLTNVTYEKLIAYLCEQPVAPPPSPYRIVDDPTPPPPSSLLPSSDPSIPSPPSAPEALEEALSLLSSLKARPNWGPNWGQGPTRRTYECLVMRMAKGDDPRTAETMKEMREMGYTVGKFLEKFVWDRMGARGHRLRTQEAERVGADGEGEVGMFGLRRGGEGGERGYKEETNEREDLGVGKAHLVERG